MLLTYPTNGYEFKYNRLTLNLMPAFLYILESEVNGRYYIGSTTDLETRLQHHNAGRTPSTRPYKPWKLVYKELYTDVSAARKRENYLKSLKSRKAIEQLFT